MTAKRYGEGSVYEDSRGFWCGVVEMGTDANGQRLRKVVRARSKDDMLTKLRDAQSKRDKGLPVGDGAMTVSRWLDHWLTRIIPRTVAASSAEHYRIVLDTRVTPYLGRKRLTKLTPEHVEDMMGKLEERGLKPNCVREARSVLRAAIREAERRGLVARNVASLAVPPRKPRTRLDDALDVDQAEAVLTAATGDRLEALAMLVLATGMRQGEALALRWDDVDLDGGSLIVRKAKTDAGLRLIALPPFVVAALRQHRTRQRREQMAAPVWTDSGLVFTTPQGDRIPKRTVLTWWHKLTIAAGVGRRRFHASRATVATLMLNNGVTLDVVSATLGHAGLAITADVYAKVRPELQRTAADAMQQVLGASR
jgi:integrase